MYLTPDRSPDERAARRLLVGTLGARMKEEQQFYHFIRDGKICKSDKKTTDVPVQQYLQTSSAAQPLPST